MTLVTPKNAAKPEFLFNRLALGLRNKMPSIAAALGAAKFEGIRSWFVEHMSWTLVV
jgi:hypothetical protein